MTEDPPARDGAGRRFQRVFVLRIWREAGRAGDATRGSIIELESGRRLYFAHLSDLHDFLSFRLAAPLDET